VSTIPTADSTFGYAGPEGRRSTRIERPVPLLITGHDGMGQEFLERTSAVSLNLHGCRYPSRHDTHVGTWVTMQIGDSGVGEIVTTVRAQVRSVQVPRNPRDLYHVGVQLEKPANIWRIPSPPPDWLTAAQRVAGELPPSKEQTAAATGPGRAPTPEDIPQLTVTAKQNETGHTNGETPDRILLTEALAGLASAVVPASPVMATTSKSGAAAAPATPAVPEIKLPETRVAAAEATAVSSFVGAGAAAAAPAPAPSAPAYEKPNRVAITPERLLAALQPKIEKAAETAILSAVNKHLTPALHAAINSLDEARAACVKQMEDTLTQQRSAVLHGAREELLARLEDRLDEVRGRWDAQLDGYRVRAEEIVHRIDRQAGAAQKNLGDAREVTERALREVQTKISSMATDALADALREFDQGIKQGAHQQLTKVLDEVQGLTREATAYLESNVAEARATVQTAASEALSEFRRQVEIHATVTASDTTQRVTSALAALDAEHRAACDMRRNSIQSEVMKSTEQVTEQFRAGLRAFFYSCLVAAVGAVEQHSQTTREGFQFDPRNFLPPDE
jgi:hypothetical protein